jgi:hypothetical protein
VTILQPSQALSKKRAFSSADAPTPRKGQSARRPWATVVTATEGIAGGKGHAYAASHGDGEMIEMSPFYAHDSSVGPVFDVATWSRVKAGMSALMAAAFAVLVAALLILAWKPTLLIEKPPEIIAEFHQETLKLQKEHPWWAYGGTGFVALVGWIALAGSCAFLLDASRKSSYYFRVGPGGISACVPHGFDLSKLGLVFEALTLEMPFERIADWQIVQHKRLGSMSRNTGNISAVFKIRTVDGRREEFSLDCFREPAHVIHSKIHDALQMVPAQFGAPREGGPARGTPAPSGATAQGNRQAIRDALAQLVDPRRRASAVVLSHADDGKFVQFAVDGGSLLLDLPRQALDEKEHGRATELFARARHAERGSETESSAQAAVAVETGFQVRLADVEEAGRLALEVFDVVYRLPEDFPLVVEHL